MFSRLLVPILLSAPLLSCGEQPEPYRICRADFSPAMVEDTKNFVREVAEKRGLYLHEGRWIYEPKLNDMESSLVIWLFRDEQAYRDEFWILTVSIWVDGGTIDIGAVDPDFSGMPIRFLDHLVSELVAGLENRLNLRFCRMSPKRSLCEMEGEPRLLFKADFPSLTGGVRSLMFDMAEARGVHMLWTGSGHAEREEAEESAFEVRMEHWRTRGKPEVVVSNMAKASVVTLAAFDHDETPFEDVEDLAREVKRTLERDFGLDFCRANPATSLCDAEHDTLEAWRQAWLAARGSDTPERLEAFLAAQPENPYAPAARRRLERLRSSMAILDAPDTDPAGAEPAGETFVDSLRSGGAGPEMAVIPAGSFLMGCASKLECEDKEGPVREVLIARPLAMSTKEVTYEEYHRFANPRGRLDESWLRRPAAHVSWGDASAYAEWLSGETGARYRLPSEAEWEYAARAGSATNYAWGNGIEKERARYRRSPRHSLEMISAPVGSHAANAWGLRDMHGNVAEWVSDCWNPDYLGAPADGSSWTAGDCSLRVARGGSWFSAPQFVRSASRARKPAGNRYRDIGFRVVREL